MSKNIELFDKYTLMVLSELYQSFPVKIDIEIINMVDDGVLDMGMILDKNGERSKQSEIAWGTIEWLVSAGYIEASQPKPYYAFNQAWLTAKGLEVLRATPKHLNKKQSLGDCVVETTKQGLFDTSKALMTDIISHAVRLGAGF